MTVYPTSTLTCKPVKLDCILLTVIVDIDNGAAVAFDDLLLQLLILFFTEVETFSGIVVSTCSCLLTGDAAHLIRLSQRILIIISVLFPVEYLVLDRLPLPPGSQRHALGQQLTKGELLIPIVPAQEGVARAGGSGRLCRDGIRGHKDRGDVAAAVGLKGDPVAGFYLGVERNIFAADVNRIPSRLCAVLIIIPALNAFIRTHGEGHIGSGNRRTRNAFLGGADHAVLVQEKDIVHLLENSMVGVGYTSDIIFLTGGEGIASSILVGIPAGKLIALFLRGLRSKDSVTGHDILGVYQCAILIEFICINLVFLIGFHHIHGGHEAVVGRAVSSPGVQRQHGEHHDKCQECGEYPFC